ncbi:MAG TPA: hypothetical protein V6C69_06360 [Trichormus sp.]
MRRRRRNSRTLVLVFVASWLAVVSTAHDAWARHKKSNQNDQINQTAMEIFPIQRGYDGAQFIVTKAGYLVSLPGLGIAPDATQIAAYRDEQNNIWYIDRNGAPVKLTDQQVQWGIAQINQQAQARGMMPAQPIQEQQQAAPNVVVVQQPTESSGGGGSGIGTGIMAAGGAMAGAALSNAMYHNNYNGIPYGTPVYHGNGGRCYYNGANGSRNYINNSNNKYVNQFNHQSNWQHTQRNNPSQIGHGNHAAQLPTNGGFSGRSRGHNLRSGGSLNHVRSGGSRARASAGRSRGGGGGGRRR